MLNEPPDNRQLWSTCCQNLASWTQLQPARLVLPRTPALMFKRSEHCENTGWVMLIRRPSTRSVAEHYPMMPSSSHHRTTGNGPARHRSPHSLNWLRSQSVILITKDLKNSREGQLDPTLVEMKTIQAHFNSLEETPRTLNWNQCAQTWSEHCSHKTLTHPLSDPVSKRESLDERQFDNMLKETIFAATQTIRNRSAR